MGHDPAARATRARRARWVATALLLSVTLVVVVCATGRHRQPKRRSSRDPVRIGRQVVAPAKLGDPWPQPWRDQAHTSLSPAVGPVVPVRLWEYRPPSDPDRSSSAQDIVGGLLVGRNGAVYVRYGETQPRMVAIGPDGGESWTIPAPPVPAHGGIALTPDGTIRMCAGGEAYLIDPIGVVSEIVTARTDRLSTVGRDGTLYTTQGSSIAATAPDGSELWTTAVEGTLVTTGPVIGDDGAVYALAATPSGGSRLYAFEPGGAERWSADLQGIAAHDGGVCIGADGTLYCGTDYGLSAVTRDGVVAWSTEVRPGVRLVPAASPDGTIYVSGGNAISAVSRDGPVKWRYEASVGEAVKGNLVVDVQGSVYARSDRNVWAVRADGKFRWVERFDAGNGPTANDTSYLALDDDGRLYCATPQGVVIAIGQAPDAGGKGRT